MSVNASSAAIFFMSLFFECAQHSREIVSLSCRGRNDWVKRAHNIRTGTIPHALSPSGLPTVGQGSSRALSLDLVIQVGNPADRRRVNMPADDTTYVVVERVAGK